MAEFGWMRRFFALRQSIKVFLKVQYFLVKRNVREADIYQIVGGLHFVSLDGREMCYSVFLEKLGSIIGNVVIKQSTICWLII